MIFIDVTLQTLFKLFQVLILSAIKFLFGPPLSFQLGFTYLETILMTTAGGIIGVIFFYYLSEGILRISRVVFPAVIKFFWPDYREFKASLFKRSQSSPVNKRKFTFRNKTIVKIRRNYGFAGIIFLTPVLLSIPLGSFLINKYYSKRKNNLFYLSMSVVFWSLVMSSFFRMF